MSYPIVLTLTGLVLTILLGILSFVIRWTRVRNFLRKYSQKFLYNFYIRLFFQEYLVIAIAALLKMTSLNWSSKFQISSSLLGLSTTLVVFFAPYTVKKFLYTKWLADEITSEKFQ